MKTALWQLFLLFVGLWISLASYGSSAITVMAPTMIRIPYGTSFYETSSLRVMPPLNPLEVRYQPSIRCPVAPMLALQVRYERDMRWVDTTYERDGKYSHPGGVITGLRLKMYQTSYQEIYCQIEVVGYGAAEFRYAGFLSYAGGFLNRASISLERTETFRGVKLKIPQFCQSSEIVEVAGMVGERFVFASKSRDDNQLFWFDAPYSLANLYISVNGPRSQGCDIPIYIQ